MKKEVREEMIHEIGNREIAQRLVKVRKKWEKEQKRNGKREILVPHPTIPRTFIVKYE